MKKILTVSALAFAGLVATPSNAAADLTFFLGLSPTPDVRSARGFAVGINLLIVGFEFDYSSMTEEAPTNSPGLKSGMFNVLVLTPTTGVQLYGTVGGGMYREYSFTETETHFGTNVGGGLRSHSPGRFASGSTIASSACAAVRSRKRRNASTPG